jgi:hypothetical protein
MKKLLSVALCLSMYSFVFAQNAHKVVYSSRDGDEKTLEALTSSLRSSEGLKGQSYKLVFKGLSSENQIKKNETLKFLIEKGEGVINLEKGVRIVQFDLTKNNRITETLIPLMEKEVQNPKLVSDGTVQLIETKQIEVIIPNLEVGEYAFVLGDVDFTKNKSAEGKSIIFYCFSVIE